MQCSLNTYYINCFSIFYQIGVRVSDIMLTKKYSNNYQKQDQNINQIENFSSLEKI